MTSNLDRLPLPGSRPDKNPSSSSGEETGVQGVAMTGSSPRLGAGHRRDNQLNLTSSHIDLTRARLTVGLNQFKGLFRGSHPGHGRIKLRPVTPFFISSNLQRLHGPPKNGMQGAKFVVPAWPELFAPGFQAAGMKLNRGTRLASPRAGKGRRGGARGVYSRVIPRTA
jgi:hypothetical protein